MATHSPPQISEVEEDHNRPRDNRGPLPSSSSHVDQGAKLPESERPEIADTINADTLSTHPSHLAETQVKTEETGPFTTLREDSRIKTTPAASSGLASFDWDDFEARYEQALAEADHQEQELLQEFNQLVKVNDRLSPLMIHDVLTEL
jgi:hypothetical protein